MIESEEDPIPFPGHDIGNPNDGLGLYCSRCGKRGAALSHPCAAPAIKLNRAEQVAVLKDIAERCDDIADDVMQITGWDHDGALLGIKAVAEAQMPRIANLIANLESE